MSESEKIAEWIYDAVRQQPTPAIQLLAIIARQQLEINEHMERLEHLHQISEDNKEPYPTKHDRVGAAESQNRS